jgi:plasmid maintenance system antidote protein VapI
VVAETFGVTRRTVSRWKADGLTIDQADTLAVALDTHPAELWGPVVWNDAIDAHESHLEQHARRHGLRVPVFA